MQIEQLSKLSGRAKLEYLAEHMNKYRPEDIGPCEIVSYKRAGQAYHNLHAVIPATTLNAKSVAITAHHDTVNPNSDNCLDNTASVYNLAKIHNKLIEAGTNTDIIIGITDAEESCNATINGVGELLLTYDPDYLVDLELSASGGELISTQYGRFDLFKYRDIVQPYNNAKVAWSLVKGLNLRLRGSTCVAMVSQEDLIQLSRKRFCDRWAQCHSTGDSFDRWLDWSQMEAFQDEIVRQFGLSILPF